MFKLVALSFAIAGAIAAAGPILIHLLNRRRYRVVDWAAMDFLRQALQRSRRVLQLRDLILLLLRVAAVLLFGLALAQPFFTRGDDGAMLSYGIAGASLLAALACGIWAVVSGNRASKFLAGVLCLAAVACCVWGVTDVYQREVVADGGAQSSRQPVHAILVVDNSLSMGYQPLGRTLLDEAKAKAAGFIDQLPGGSRISVLPLCGPKSQMSTEPFRTKEDAFDALNGIQVVDRQATAQQAAALALAAQKKAPDLAVKRVVFIGDQQRGNWPAGSLESAKDLQELQVVQVSADSIDNAWVEDLRLRDGIADAQTPATLIATLRYQGTKRKSGVQVTLDVDGVQVASKTVDLEPGQALDVSFTHRFDLTVEPGAPAFSRVAVAIPKDRLPQDDRRNLVVPVVSALPVVFVDQYGAADENEDAGRIGETRHLRRLLAPVLTAEDRQRQLIKIRHTTIDRLCRSLPPGEEPGELTPLEDARLVVMAGVEKPDPATIQLLREYVQQGGQVVLAAGGEFDPAAWNREAWLEGGGLLPLPLTGEIVGETPRESQGGLRPFFLDFHSLKEDPYFKIENEQQSWLEDLYRDPSLMFFKAVAAKAEAATLDEVVANEAKRINENREFLKQEAERARREAEGLLSEEELLQRQKDKQRLEEIQPDWLLWKDDAYDPSANDPVDEIAVRTRPRVRAAFTDGKPFMVERQIGRGRVLFLSSGVFYGSDHAGWNTLTTTDALVVYNRILRSFIQNTLPRRNWDSLDEIHLPVSPGHRRAHFTLDRPEKANEPLAVEALGAEHYGVTVRDAVHRGVYTVTARRSNGEVKDSGKTIEGVDATLFKVPLAVAGPGEESDIRPLPEADFQKRLDAATPEIAAKVRWISPERPIQLEGAARGGQDFWWKVFMAAVLICLLVELAVLVWTTFAKGAPTGGGVTWSRAPQMAVVAAASVGILAVAVVLLSWLTGLERWFSLDWLRHVKLAAGWANTKGGAAALVAGVVALVLLSVWFYSNGQRRQSSRTRVALAVCRAAVLVALLLLLAEPLLVRTYTSVHKPQLWFVVDGTDSMAIEDELTPQQRKRLEEALELEELKKPDDKKQPDARHRSRAEYVRALFAQEEQQNLLKKLGEKFRLKFFLFDEGVREVVDFDEWSGQPESVEQQLTTKGQFTSLGTSFNELARRQAASSLAGMIVVSDFDQNSGPSADVAAARLGVPVYAVGVGPSAAMDVRVRLDTPIWMTKNERSEVVVTVEQQEVEQPNVTVFVTAKRIDNVTDPALAETISVGPKEGKVVQLDASAVMVPFPFTPPETGQFLFSAEVKPLEGEVVDQNNVATRDVNVRDDFLRLSFVEYEPTWEWRFIKEVFHRDKLVGMRGFRTFLRSSDPKVRQTNELFTPTLTPKRSEFFANDVIFLGDMPAGTLNTRFCDLVKEFVGKFGGGLVVISGPRFGPGQLAGTPLADMLPVVVDPELRIRDQREFPLHFTPEAFTHPFMRLGAGDEENAKAWKNLSRLPWYQPVARATDRATVLAVHPEDRASNGQPQPLIALRQYGDGIVIYLGFNETWRLRRKFGERYYRQFWGQMIHQLASRRALGTQKRFVVATDRPQYRVDEQVVLSVEAFDEDYQPLSDEKSNQGKLVAEVIRTDKTAAGGVQIEHYTISRRREAMFETKFRVAAGGEYRVRVKDPVTNKYAETRFKVQDVSAERRSAVRNTALQVALAAAIDGGKAYELHEAAELISDIPLEEKKETHIQVQPLWTTWFCFALLASLMLGEWLVRKLVTLP